MSIDELNELVRNGGIDEFIRVCEAAQTKELSKVADTVVSIPGARLVLVSGASSAGKTTAAKRLCTQLRVNGAEALHMSTDDYFVGNSRNPRDENGAFDYETVEAVDSARLSADICALLSGDAVHLRRFDFAVHEGFDAEAPSRLRPGAFVVLEGLHALNPVLTAGVDDGCKFRMFVEPKTQVEVFARTRLRPADARFMRRLVRDNQFRKLSPVETFEMWPKVVAGERKWVDPFRPLAAVEFDSGLEYELAVLKPYVAGLLVTITMKRGADAVMPAALLRMLSLVHEARSAVVPGDSILRETIGGSALEY